MLKTLAIRHYVLIDELRVDFQTGLNIITGETGAGKSILIGALGGLLGDKMGREVIRSGADRAVVEGEFDVRNVPGIADYLNEHDVEVADDGLIIRREVSTGGKSRCFINDQPVSIVVLSGLGDLLVDLHGQHEHQLLLQVAHHGDYLDAFAGLAAERTAMKEKFLQLTAGVRELQEVERTAREAEKSRDFMRFQLNEINAIAPQAGEDEALKAEEQILHNAEMLYERTGHLFQKLYEADGSAAEILAAAESDLAQLAQIDERFRAMVTEAQNARIVVQELAQSVRRYSQDISFDPERLEKIRSRGADLAGLKRKYGGTLDAVLDQAARLTRELDLIENLDEAIAGLQKKLEEVRAAAGELSRNISGCRKKAAGIFSERVQGVLEELGMPRARFNIRQTFTPGTDEPHVRVDRADVRIGPRGFDHVEFLLAANPGEEDKPLAVVASGGEISRVMLALKSLLAEADQVPVLVFDEIDIGISGRIAQAVGRNLKTLGRSHQVLCITHLPQIASMADHHFLVEKSGDEMQTRTTIRPLTAEESIRQIAALLGGEIVTEAHLRSAAELVQEAGRAAKSGSRHR
jgi:DNA repair protein RecN (Recombination protein N)